MARLNMRDMLFNEIKSRYGATLDDATIDAAVFSELGQDRDNEWRAKTAHSLNPEYQMVRRGVIRRLES